MSVASAVAQLSRLAIGETEQDEEALLLPMTTSRRQAYRSAGVNIAMHGGISILTMLRLYLQAFAFMPGMARK